jgi:hypothetical protein
MPRARAKLVAIGAGLACVLVLAYLVVGPGRIDGAAGPEPP